MIIPAPGTPAVPIVASVPINTISSKLPNERDAPTILAAKIHDTLPIMEARRKRNVLHKAIEAKERLKIKYEIMTSASITCHKLFLMCQKLAGKTGMAKTK